MGVQRRHAVGPLPRWLVCASKRSTEFAAAVCTRALAEPLVRPHEIARAPLARSGRPLDEAVLLKPLRAFVHQPLFGQGFLGKAAYHHRVAVLPTGSHAAFLGQPPAVDDKNRQGAARLHANSLKVPIEPRPGGCDRKIINDVGLCMTIMRI